MVVRAVVLAVAGVALSWGFALGQFPPGPGPYDPGVPAPADLRGFETGERFSTYRDVERVLEGIAEGSDRVTLERYGTTVEGRALRLAWVSSPTNLERLDALRAANRAATTGRAPADRPIFVWLSFGIHGDEASSPETALELLYHLAASRDPEVEAWLDHAVVVVDPLLNPDGHERYAGWYRSVVGPEPDPDPTAREHRPPWPAGRTNHWYFDLNRDWAWGVQPETRARRAVYLETLPQVHVDFHEMDPSSSYFFFPAADPLHPHYPESTHRWGRIFGGANASAFDARRWPYFTAEEFDLFYPGYGDSWPSYFGATGMTYEQAGGGRAGLALELASGDTLTLRRRAEKHLVAGLTTIETAVERRAERLADFDAFWRSPRPPDAPAAWLVEGGSPDGRALARLLAEQGIAVDTLAAGLSTDGLTPYRATGAEARSSVPPGTFLLSAEQPLGRYLATLMAAEVELPDSTLFYDITGWSLPYLYGVPTWRASRRPSVPHHRWDPGAREGSSPLEPPPGTVALAWAYDDAGDAIAAGRLAADGWSIRVAEAGFRAAGHDFPAGSFVLRLDEQGPDRRDAGIAGAALAESGRIGSPVALTSSEAGRGIDVGSNRMRPLRAPAIAIVAGPGTEPTSVGATRHFLEAEADLPVEVVRLVDLAAAPGVPADSATSPSARPLRLDRYTTVVLPDADGADAYAAALGEPGTRRLAEWVRAGGTLVGIRAGAAWLAEDASGLAGFALAEKPDPTEAELRAPTAVRQAEAIRDRIPGTIVAVAVDSTHALGWGYPGRAAVLVRDPVEIEISEGANPWLYRDAGPLAGYLPVEARDRLAATPYVVAERSGEGWIVGFADDPAFRGILHGLKKALLNAMLILPGG
ncbi:MAG: M14 family zinc carboxypeptidase [Gemmatimonadota bacterium]|nr:M14 family zinc carboxypeptidase [Gemmatimonadota bacterium]